MLGGIDIQNGGPLWQSHEYVGLHLGLSVCHDEVDGPHVPPEEQGKYKDATDGCPGYNRSKCRPVSVSIYLSMTSRTKAGLPLYDFICWVTLARSVHTIGMGFAFRRTWDLWTMRQCFSSECSLSSFSMALMNLSQSG